MLVSRALAKARIARGERPGWLAAWGPVMVDAACLALVLYVAFGLFQTLTASMHIPLWATIAALFTLGFIPIQAVLIFSSLWAAKSRWTDTEPSE